MTNLTHSLYTSHKAVLIELIDDARIHYQRTSVSRVTLHMTDGVRFSHACNAEPNMKAVSSIRGPKQCRNLAGPCLHLYFAMM